MEFRILGPVEAVEDGLPVTLGGPKQRALLAVLLLNANQVVSTERLIEALWEDPPARAVKAVQVYASRLRKTLGGAPKSRPPGYVLELVPEQLDLTCFRRLRAEARDDPVSAAEKLREALSLWRGPALAEVVSEPFARVERLRLEEERMEALEERIDSDLALGRHSALTGELEALVAAEPVRERLRGQLMLALYRCGRQSDALAAYRDGRRQLVEELGIEPRRVLRDLHQAILEQNPKLDLDGVDVAPPASEGKAPAVFVGRTDELSELVRAFNDVIGGEGRLVLVTGEPGIGKSRLGEELAGRARAAGAHVLAGRCWEAGGAPPYWPWVQLLRSYVRATDTELRRRLLGASGSELTTLLPELHDLLPDLPETPASEAVGARFRLFDAVVSLLTNAAQARPLVLVLDDLHSADEPSLLLLRFLARELEQARILVVGAYRNVDPTVRDPLSATLAELIREPVTRRIELIGLLESEVAEYISRTGNGHAPEHRVVAEIHAETDGNPFFVGEVTRLLLKEGALEPATGPVRIRVPQSVRDLIGRRLARLSDDCRRALMFASVLGREFPVNAVARFSELREGTLLELLDEAMVERVVGAVPDSRSHLRFAHALIRDTLYEDLTPARRMRLHQRAGEILEASYGDRLGSHLTEVAHHFVEAASAGDFEKAIDYTQRAGNRAARLLAFEEAARLYRLALSLIDDDDHASQAERCELLLDLGDVQARVGDMPLARETFLQAAELAEATGSSDLLARSALGYGGRFVWTGRDIHGMVPLLERAANALGQELSPLRVCVLARLANAISQQRPQAGETVSAEALAIARRLEDPTALAYALSARLLATRAPTDLEQRWRLTEELIAAPDKERAFEGHAYRTIIQAALGDLPGIRQELDVMGELAEELGQPSQRWWTASTSAMLALVRGRFDDAEQLIEQARALAEHAVGYDAIMFNEVQRFALRRDQGRLLEALPGLEHAVETERAAGPDARRPLLRCVLALAYWELGLKKRALRLFDELAVAGYAQLSINNDWLLSASLLAEIAAGAGDVERAKALYLRLVPFDGLNVDTEEVSTGAVSRYLGLLAMATGRFEQAELHFAAALAMNKRIGARPWLARAQEDYGRLLLTGGHPAERSQALELLAAASDAYRELGMNTHAQRASALTHEVSTAV